jgi:hypothetical protein
MLRVITAGIVALFAISAAAGNERELSSADIRKIKRVCGSWIGRDCYYPPRSFRRELIDYCRAPDMLTKKVLDCSSNNCGSTFLLRGDADIYYHCPNGGPTLGPGPICTVAFHIHGQRVLLIGPIEGDPIYPYPSEKKQR